MQGVAQPRYFSKARTTATIEAEHEEHVVIARLAAELETIPRESRTILGAAGITLGYPIMRHANNFESVLTYEVHQLVIGQAPTGHAAYR